jgi:sugar/nucleoside kinase (ribokinase family)
MRGVACVGEIAIDEYVGLATRYISGISFNLAWNLRQLGVTCELFADSGKDVDGQCIKQHLDALQLESHSLRVAQTHTIVRQIKLNADGESSVETPHPRALKPNLSLDAETLSNLQNFDAVHVSLTPGLEGVFDSIACNTKAPCKIADLSIGYGGVAVLKATLERYAAAFQLVCIVGDRQHQPLISEFARAFPHTTFVLMLGKEGARCFSGQGIFSQPALQIRGVVDATGSVEAFEAGFIARWLRDRDDLFGALMAGTLQAARVARHVGATGCVIGENARISLAG